MGTAREYELDRLGSPQLDDTCCKHANKIWVLVKGGNTPNGRAASSFLTRTVPHIGTN
jgi:hypothetical protein